MAFSVKQLLVFMLIAGLGMGALANADRPFANESVNLLTVGVLLLMAYGVWVSEDEIRAFRIGFLCWVALFWCTIKWPYNIGADRAISVANEFLRPSGPVSDWINSYYVIARCLLSLLAGFIGGWVTVYFYRKRQLMLSHRDKS